MKKFIPLILAAALCLPFAALAEDAVSSASVADFYGQAALTGDDLMNAINSFSGFYLVTTTNPDNSPNAAFFVFGMVKHEDHYYVQLSLAENQSRSNLLANGEGVAVYAATPSSEEGAKPFATSGARIRFKAITDEAVAAALAACAPSAERRVLVAHQMVVAGLCPPQLSGSETAPLTVGTVDSVDAAHFAGFSYTALGHIHRAQRVGSDTVRYAGAPLCYHLDECGMEKSATLVRLGRRGVDGIDTLPLHPRRAMRHIVGPLAKLVEHPADTGDYIWATLTDPTPQPDAMAMLRTAYPNAMRLDYRPQGAEILPADTAQSVRGKPFASLFEDFFTQMNGRPLTVEEARAVKALREEASK